MLDEKVHSLHLSIYRLPGNLVDGRPENKFGYWSQTLRCPVDAGSISEATIFSFNGRIIALQ